MNEPLPGPQPEPTEGLALPHSVTGEKEVLSAVLVDPGVMDSVIELLPNAEDFYLDRHALVYEAMKRAYEATGTVDLVTLQQDLRDNGTWEKAGGSGTLSDLLDRAGTASNVVHYCEIVRRKAIIRRMIEAARSIETDAFQDITDVSEFLDRSEQRVFEVLEDRVQTALRPISDVVYSTIKNIEAVYNADGSVTGVPTGYRDLDSLTQGFQRGDLIIVAARPAMGKTSLVLNIAANAAMNFGAKVALFSLEMPAEQLATRMLAAHARIDVSRLRGGFLTDSDWPKLVNAADEIRKAKLYIDDSAAISPSAMKAKCRRLARQDGLDLVIIDYLQLMNAPSQTRSREQEISHISRSLKHLAKDLEVPVVALSQLNRGVEGRTDKRPQLSDLRESGAIEQDADLITFLYRDEVYNKSIEEEARGIAEVIVGKHRNGPTGTVKLKFWHAYTRFDNLAKAAHGP